MALELVTPLPPGAPSHTRLAKHGARLVVLREILDGTDCSWPQPSPNMVTLQEVGELQGKRHALFPWVPGVTLRELVKALELAGNPVPIGLVGRVLIDAARALSAVTPARPHGGLQDAALQIGFDGVVSVLDWGAPRVSRFRPIGRVNFAADVFALGGVLHTVLTGFQGEYASPPVQPASPSTSHAEATPAIDDVVLRALSAQPDSRQSDAATFADEVEVVLSDQLFSSAKLAEVVSALFKDRIKILQSLGGIIEASSPSLEAVLPLPAGTQPGTGGPRPEPPSEPTLPRIAELPVGEGSLERTDVRIPLPSEAGAPSRSLVPWESGDGLPPAPPTELLPGPRPSSPHALEPVTNPRAELPVRAAEPDTNPRVAPPKVSAPRPSRAGMSAQPSDDQADTHAAAPRPGRAASPADTDETSGASKPNRLPSDTDESSAPKPRGSAPRPLGAEEEHAPTRPSGPRALSRSDFEAQRPPRAAPTRPGDSDSDVAPRTVANEVDDTNPRARAPAPDLEAGDTGPLPPPPRPRNTTEAERQRALGQERLRTPPQGTALEDLGAELGDEGLLNEPTAVRPKVDPMQTAQTAQSLKAASAPASSGTGLRVVMVLLLVVVVGLAGAVGLKLKRQSEQPLPFDETMLEVDAGAPEAAQPPDAGQAALATVVTEVPADAGDDEEEDDDADAGLGEALDGGPTVTIDAGVEDAGVKPPVKKPVKKPVKRPVKKKKRR